MKTEATILIHGKSADHPVEITLEGEPEYVNLVIEKLLGEYGDLLI